MTKTKRAYLLTEEGTEPVAIPELEGKELKLSDIYPIIGNGCDIVERVQLKKGVEMWVDEEGTLKENKQNQFASHLAWAVIRQGVVGKAVIIDNSKEGFFR